MRFLTKNSTFLALKLTVGLAIYWILWQQGKISFAFFSARYAGLLWLLLILQSFVLLLGALRWHLIARRVGDVGVSFSFIVFVSWVGQFFNLVLPTTLGADINRVYWVHQRGKNIPPRTLIYVTAADRICSMLAVGICAALGVLLYWGSAGYLLTCAGLLMLFAGVQLTGLGPLSGYLRKKGWKTPPRAAVSLSVLIRLFKAFAFYLIVAFVLRQGGAPFFNLCLAAQAVEALRVAPANIGIGHFLFQEILTFVNSPEGAQVYNIYFSIAVLFNLTGFAGFLMIRRKK